MVGRLQRLCKESIGTIQRNQRIACSSIRTHHFDAEEFHQQERRPLISGYLLTRTIRNNLHFERVRFSRIQQHCFSSRIAISSELCIDQN
jgi:hypothetical protein